MLHNSKPLTIVNIMNGILDSDATKISTRSCLEVDDNHQIIFTGWLASVPAQLTQKFTNLYNT